MGSINDAHQADGGVLLFSGELILLYCDSVQCEIKGKGSTKGRIFLTTHRIVFTSSAGHNASVKSFSAPFFAMSGLSLEQPIFGANSIKGKVSGQQEFQFELKFNKGGATEFAQAMRNAAKQAQANSQQSGYQPPPAYSSTPDPSSYYQTPVDNVYQPNYPVGFVLPTQQFSQAPPPGFIYACDVPPPYPGIVPPSAPPTTMGPSAMGPAGMCPTGMGPAVGLVSAAVPGMSVVRDPVSLMMGTSSIQPAVYPTAAAIYPTASLYPQQPTPGFQNGAGFHPPPPGLNIDNPPTYDEATKKSQ